LILIRPLSIQSRTKGREVQSWAGGGGELNKKFPKWATIKPPI
jgi:hypothetical protein